MSKMVEEIQNWDETSTIRNISIISHVDHGKTTFSDYLMASGGMLPTHLAGSLRALDDLPEEQKRGITIETSYVSYIMEYEKKRFMINLIDTPGHVDFSGKVAESLRLVDGGFILVDAVEGIMAQTKTVLYQAIEVGLELVLFINKIDRLILELNYTNTQIQGRIEQIIGEIAMIYKKLESKKAPPNFSKGTILIGSALDGWAIDIDFVQNGGKIEKILDKYKSNKFHADEEIDLKKIVSRCISQQFPNPKDGQKTKGSVIFSESPNNETISSIVECDPNRDVICQVGRINRLSNNTQISYIIRILSGKIKRGDIIYSNIGSQRIRITKLFQMFGRSNRDIKELKAGQIGGITTTKPLFPGDLLTKEPLKEGKLNAISYVQEPVISISIESKDIKEIGKVQQAIQSLVESTPGLKYEENKETGELVIMGIGTLQLDVLRSELLEMDLNVDISDPIILQYEMPSNPIEFDSEKIAGLKVRVNLDCDFKDFHVVYEDGYNNQLSISSVIPKEAVDGLVEVFRQYMRISPQSGEKVRDFRLCLVNYPDHRINRTYENGMIMGSQIIKEAMSRSQTIIFEPYYDVEITLPEKYIGVILQEIQKYGSKIEDVTYRKIDSLILCKIKVEDAQKLSDNLRQVSDGYGFWSYKAIQFLSKSDFF